MARSAVGASLKRMHDRLKASLFVGTAAGGMVPTALAHGPVGASRQLQEIVRRSTERLCEPQ